MKLVDGLQVATFAKDEFVFHEGDTGDKFYIIESGSCDCLKVNIEAESGHQQVRELSEGDHFGEIAILKNVKRTLSIRANSELKLLVLTRETFSRILGSIKDFLKEDYQREATGIDTSFESADSHSVAQAP
jgi:CRP-like cAMP-binding protein